MIWAMNESKVDTLFRGNSLHEILHEDERRTFLLHQGRHKTPSFVGMSAFFSSSSVFKMKPTLVTTLLFAVALASKAFAEGLTEAQIQEVNRCASVPVDECTTHRNCGIVFDGKHITCTSTAHS